MLCDFGLSKSVLDAAIRSTSHTLINGAWLSPELMASYDATKAGDVWAFGCTFLEVVFSRSASDILYVNLLRAP